MGKYHSKQFQNIEQNFQIDSKNSSIGIIKLCDKQSQQRYICRKISVLDKKQIYQIQRLIDLKLSIQSPFITKLQKVQKQQKQQYCTYGKNYYLIFKQPYQTLKQQTLNRKFKNSKYSQQQLSLMLQIGVKGLSFLKNIQHPHQNISSNSFFINENRSIILGDPFMFTKQNQPLIIQNGFIYPSPQILKFQNNQISKYNQYLSDLFTFGLVLLEVFFMENMDCVYEKRFEKVNYSVINSKLNQIKSIQLRKKIFILLDPQPKNRQIIFKHYLKSIPSIQLFRQKSKQRFIKNIERYNLATSQVTQWKNDLYLQKRLLASSQDQKTFTLSTTDHGPHNYQDKNHNKYNQNINSFKQNKYHLQKNNNQKQHVSTIQNKQKNQHLIHLGKMSKNNTKGQQKYHQDNQKATINSHNYFKIQNASNLINQKAQNQIYMKPINNKNLVFVNNQNNKVTSSMMNRMPINNPNQFSFNKNAYQIPVNNINYNTPLNNYSYPSYPLPMNNYSIFPNNNVNFNQNVYKFTDPPKLNINNSLNTNSIPLISTPINNLKNLTYSSQNKFSFNNLNNSNNFMNNQSFNSNDYIMNKISTFKKNKQQQQKIQQIKIKQNENKNLYNIYHSIQTLKNFQTQKSNNISLNQLYLNQNKSQINIFNSIINSNKSLDNLEKQYQNKIRTEKHQNINQNNQKSQQKQKITASKIQTQCSNQNLKKHLNAPQTFSSKKIQPNLNKSLSTQNYYSNMQYLLSPIHQRSQITDSARGSQEQYKFGHENEEQFTKQTKSKKKSADFLYRSHEVNNKLSNNQNIKVSDYSQSANYQNQQQNNKIWCIEYPSGTKYQGQMKNDRRNGSGAFYYLDGSKYKGNWFDNKMNGFGTLYYPTGKIAYQGQWKMDNFHGKGKIYNDDPTKFQGKYDYKKCQAIDQIWLQYDGDIQDDRRQGKGMLKLVNGQKFQGTFVDDQLNGQCKFYTLDKIIIQGIWQKNTLIKLISETKIV